MTRMCALISCALSLLVLGGCSNDHSNQVAASPAAARRLLQISGSSTMKPMVGALASKFEKLHPGVRVEVVSTGSKQGIHDVRAGKAEIAMVSRNLNDDEQDLEVFPIARDGLAIVINKSNPINNFSNVQVVGIFTGALTNWAQVGGEPGEIYLITRDAGRSVLDLISLYFNVKENDIKAKESVGDNGPTIAAVASKRNSISFLSLGEAERSARNGTAIKLASIDQAVASSKNVRNGNYPLLRPLTLVTKKLPEGDVQKFIDFCLSAQATEIVNQNDFIPYLD